ncbi:hypothetical protein [Saccharopolyspora hordei]|uniref:Cas3 C-terminal domain-containing protein n=1 Tax=Saccharopolyspora hordei TaxID=1838 RepID=A0A853AG59_9PSEU|nr:hypothetical protein [Saccharopolyspora hordei]NYI83564.1 hypothetical protein [Saccharopolyspora hordei]
MIDALDLEPFDVVLLRPGAPHPTTLDGIPIDLDPEHDLTEHEQQALLNSSVQVYASDLTPRAYEVVCGLPIPTNFMRSGWLHNHHLLVLDGAARSGPVRFTVDEVTGLRIEEDEE